MVENEESGLSQRLFRYSKKNLNYSFWIILILAGIKLLVPFLVNRDFGFQRDELLYMALGNHLSWGFMAVPPFVAFIAKITHFLFGYGIHSTRFFPALSGAASLWITTLIVKEMGGRSFARILAGVAYLFSIAFLRMNLLFQPVTFNLFFFVLGAYFFVRILKTNEPKYWIWLGISIGIGLLNKYTMLLFGFGITIGLVLTGFRSLFRSIWPWLSALLAILIWLPNLIWQESHGWPFFQQMQTLNQYQFIHVHPLSFLFTQLILTFLATPLWIAGLYFLFSKNGKAFRPLGWAYFSILVVLLIAHGKAYYLAASYPMLIAAGSVLTEQYIERKSRKFLKSGIIGLIVLGSLYFIPIGIPILSLSTTLKYFKNGSKHLGMKPVLRWESGRYHSLPQDYADMLGWKTMTVQTAKIFHSLPKSEQKECSIFGNNYGEASALNYYGSRYGLPKAISGNSSYWLWGYRGHSGKIMIVIGSSKKDISQFYKQVRKAAVFRYPNAREDGIPIFVAKHPKQTMAQLWPVLEKNSY